MRYSSNDEFDLVVPDKSPNPVFDKVWKYIKGGLKGVYRGARKGEAKAIRKFGLRRWLSPYSAPFTYHAQMPYGKRKRMATRSRIRRRPVKRRRRTKPFTVKRRYMRRGKGRGAGFSWQTRTKRMRRPRNALHIGNVKRFDAKLAPHTYLHNEKSLETWNGGEQGVWFETINTRSELNTMIGAFGATNATGAVSVMTEHVKYVYWKNLTNIPVVLQVYEFIMRKSCDKSPIIAWRQGLLDIVGCTLDEKHPNIKPQQAPLFGMLYKCYRVRRIKLGGGASYQYVIKMRGNRQIHKESLADTAFMEYNKGYTKGILVVARSSIAEDVGGSGNPYFAQGKIGQIVNGHATFRINAYNAMSYANATAVTAPTGNLQSVNMEADTVQTVATT